MGEVMCVEANLGKIGVGLMVTPGRNSVPLYCHFIIFKMADKQVIFTV